MDDLLRAMPSFDETAFVSGGYSMAIRIKWNGHQQEVSDQEDKKAEWPL